MSEDLNSTVMAAASVKTTSNAWCSSPSIYRACSSVFASTLIDTLCSTTSELVHDEEQQQPSSSSPSDLEPLQPDDPTEEQTKTYNEFCQSILEVCGDCVHRLWEEQKFSFSAQHDQWDSSWTGRTGIPLEYYAKRWNELVTYPYTGTAELRALKDPSPQNMSFREENLDKPFIGRVGFGSSGGGPIDEMTASIRHRWVSEMARLFLLTCPGDWSSGQEVRLGSVLRRYAAGEEEVYTDWGLDVVACIQFRWELALIADRLVDMLGLPPPSGQPCIMWDRHRWITSIKDKIPDWDDRESRIYGSLYARGFFVHGTQRQGPPFLRFVKYVISALIEADTSDTETKERIDAVVGFMDRAKEFNKQRALEQPTVRSRSQAWLKSLGKRMRDSVQPKKRPQQPGGQVGLARRRHSISTSSVRLLPPLDLGSPLRRSASTGALSGQAWV